MFFWRDLRTFFVSCLNSHLGFYLQPTVLGENRPTDWQAAVFFLRPKHWRSLEKPWHLLPWASLANGRRAAATPRWPYVVGSHRRDFRSQVVLGCLFFLKGDFYVRITILKVYVFISSLSVIIHCIHVECLSPYCTLRYHMIRLVFLLNSLIFSELMSLCFQVFKGCPCDCFDQEPKAVVLIIHGGCGWPETQDHHDESRYVWGGSWTSKLSLVGQVLDLCTSCWSPK